MDSKDQLNFKMDFKLNFRLNFRQKVFNYGHWASDKAREMWDLVNWGAHDLLHLGNLARLNMRLNMRFHLDDKETSLQIFWSYKFYKLVKQKVH